MNKRLEVIISQCGECPFCQDYRGYIECYKTCKRTTDHDGIPQWCPLPDAGGEVQL